MKSTMAASVRTTPAISKSVAPPQSEKVGFELVPPIVHPM